MTRYDVLFISGIVHYGIVHYVQFMRIPKLAVIVIALMVLLLAF